MSKHMSIYAYIFDEQTQHNFRGWTYMLNILSFTIYCHLQYIFIYNILLFTTYCHVQYIVIYNMLWLYILSFTTHWYVCPYIYEDYSEWAYNSTWSEADEQTQHHLRGWTHLFNILLFTSTKLRFNKFWNI